jgi:hypothetical protein
MTVPQRQRPPVEEPADGSDLHLAGSIDPKANQAGRWIDDARSQISAARARRPWRPFRLGSGRIASPVLRYLELRQIVRGGS